MKVLTVVFILSITMMMTGCYSNTSKESGADSTEQNTSRSGQY